MDSSHSLDPALYSDRQVLVAEDNPANQLVLKKLLKKVGIVPVFANNGQEALDYYTAEPSKWHLIFMDCEMPVMDGYTATEEIRAYEQQNNLKQNPIVGLSAHAIAEFKEKALNNGMSDYLTKPLNRDLLYQALNKYLSL